MKVNYNEIGKRILERRKELGLTQEAITELTGISTNQVSNLENSRSVPTVETVLKLSEAMNVTPDYFLLGVARSTERAPIADITNKSLLCTDKQIQLISEFITLLIKENY